MSDFEVDFERLSFQSTPRGYEPAQLVRPTGLRPVQYTKQDVISRFPGIDASYTVAEDPEGTGMRVEMAMVNPEHVGDAFTGFGSTFGAAPSISVNNTKELAMHGAEQPHVAMLYLGHPGAGLSTNLLSSDYARLWTRGRFTEGTVEQNDLSATISMQAVAHIIQDCYGQTPRQFTANESGARFVLGLAVALEVNSVERLHLNGPPGVSAQANYGPEMLKEDLANAKERKGNRAHTAKEQQKDPGFEPPVTIDSFSAEDMKEYLPHIYAGIAAKRRFIAGNLRRAKTLPLALRAYGGHNDLNDLADHALYQDLSAVLRRHEATIVLQINRKSRLHNFDDAVRLGKEVMNAIPVELQSEKRAIELLISTGSLDAHTSEPMARAIAERASLTNIARFMKVVFRREKDTTTYVPEFSPLQVETAA